MLKGIFCHDLPIYKDINGEYCSTTLTNSVFERYLKIVDELTVATRVYNIQCTYKEAKQEKIDLSGIKFLDLPNVNKFSALFFDIPRTKKILLNAMHNVDLIFIRGGTVATLGASVAKKLKKPYLFECDGSAWDSFWYHSLKGKLVAPYFEHCAKKKAKQAAFVLYVTKNWLQKQYPTKGIGVGISDVLLPELTDEILDKRLCKINRQEEHKPFVIATTAGLVRQKGQQYVLSAIRRLRNRLNLRYEIVGGGDDKFLRSIIKKYKIEDRVIIKGQLTHDEVLKWLDTIDLYIQPSMQEGLSRAVLEAMSRACPVLGSDAGGTPELIDDKFVFKKGNVKQLCNKLLLLTKENMQVMAKRNFEKAKEFNSKLLDMERHKFFLQYKNYVLNGYEIKNL